MGFMVKQGSEKGSQKGLREGGFQNVPGTPPRRVRPLRRAPWITDPEVCFEMKNGHDRDGSLRLFAENLS